MLVKLRRDERGIALATVILVAFVLLALVASTLAFAMNSLELSRHDQDWNAALSAAEGGIDDYLYRLNRVDGYWQYSQSNPPPDGNQAFGNWVNMPGAASDATFRYSVDTSTFLTDGSIKIQATGKVRNTTRTVSATLRRRNFLDYLYFTEYETLDPVLYTTAQYGHTSTWADQNCGNKHYYDNPGRHNDCQEIFFFTRDTINGPLHSNDAYWINGNPKFLGDTSTSWNDPANKRWLGSGTPQFKPGDPKWLSVLTLPPSNSSIKLQTDPAYGGTGCLFTGPTRIVLNSTGTMSVTSPLTKSTNTGCGTNYTTGATRTISLPPNGVVYVQGVPSIPSDPNYRATCPSNHPMNPVVVGLIRDDLVPYGNCAGDAFLSGSLKGRLTVATANNIIVVDHTEYQGGLSGTDLLGLVADNYVEIYHPIECDNQSCSDYDEVPTTSGGSFFTNARVHAAILSVRHSFRVQNYQFGNPKGKLTVRGAIGQKYRGIVGTFSGNNPNSGYEKDYVYDQRLKYQSPPHFLDPVKSAWHVTTWAESKPAF